jgi:membrane protease YdiL (CAAX protease family)
MREWRDPIFWLAAGAAPVWWILLYLATAPSVKWTWPIARPVLFLQFALLYPVIEEIVFRGALQDLCHRYLKPLAFGPISLANLVTSLAFMALHIFYHPVPWAVAVLIPSLVFGYVKDRYRRLSAPIQLHCFYNAGYYWLFGAPL